MRVNRGRAIRHPEPCSEIASGIDALYLSGSANLPHRFIERLATLRSFAEECRQGVPIRLGSVPFELSHHGWGRYRYLAGNEMGRIGFTQSSYLPAIRIQPHSRYLHAHGTETAVAGFSGILDAECSPVSLSVNRLDLYVDIQGWHLSSSDRHRFVTRAEDLRTYESSGTLTGFTIGSRSSHTICARIYDKSADVAAKGTDWWYEVWGEAYRPGVPVIRVEFELGRKALGEFRIDSPQSALSSVGDLWNYATQAWLTIRSPRSDSTRSRWPIAEEWKAVQSARLVGKAVGLERIRTATSCGSLRKLLPALNGYMASFAAVVGTDDIDDTVAAIRPYLRDYETLARRSFAETVQRRRQCRIPQPPATEGR